MKKFVLIIIALVLSLSLVSCSNPTYQPNSTSNAKYQSDISQVINSSSSTVSVDYLERSEAPQYIKDIFFRFEKCCKDNNLSLKITSRAPEKLNGGDYIIDIESTNGAANLEISFDNFNNKIMKSFSIFCGSEIDNNIVIDAITAVLYAADNTATFDTAKENAEIISNSYYGDDYSKVIATENYYIFLKPYTGNTIIYAKHKSETWDDIDKTEYEKIDDQKYSDFKKPKFEDERYKVIVTGTVTNYDRKNMGSDFFQENLTVSCENGKEYVLTYLFSQCPVYFDIGSEYSFYGTVSDDKTIHIDNFDIV